MIMIAPAIVAAIMAGVGFAKGKLIDEPREKRQRAMRAEELRALPFLGTSPGVQQIEVAKPFDQALAFGAEGFNFGGRLNQAKGQSAFGRKLQGG